ncbi:LysR family transcriptional regulator [Longispora sp. K20-0274]|uniref:LysR family transcriptional regulator n=1 Tax=Longispora sp. K20-0274 TaxID=3088255 RepID=UPI00399A87FC
MLERHELDAFLTVAEELHFGRAAQRLRVSTTRVSQTIRKLERLIGSPLFHRTSRRVELSTLGGQLAAELRPAWARIAAAVESAIAAGHDITGTLRVAFVSAAGGKLMLRAAEVAATRLPGCDVQVLEARIVDALPWLRSGQADLIHINLPVYDDDLVAGPDLIRQETMLAVPAGHPFAGRPAITMEDLAETTFVQIPDIGEGYLSNRVPSRTPSGRPIVRGPHARTINEVLAMVAAGRGVFTVGALSRRYHARPDLAFVPISDAPPLRCGLVWRADAATPAIAAFAELAREVAAAGRWS